MTADIIIGGLGLLGGILSALVVLTWHMATRIARVEQRMEDHDRWERNGRSEEAPATCKEHK